MSAFQYHPDILVKFPHICGGVILANHMQNGPSPEALQAAYLDEQSAVIKRIGDTPLSELPSIASWRQAFHAFGVKPTKYRNAAEALLRRLTKKGDIPTINTIVDICNLVSIRYGLPVAAFDRRALQGAITVRFAKGNETYMQLDTTQVEHPLPGEVIFADERDRVIARRWCWRQSEDSAARADTQNAIITVEAQHPGGRRDIVEALNDLLSLIQTYAGGERQSSILEAENPGI